MNCITKYGLSKRMQDIIDSGGIFCSFEFTPPSRAELLPPLLLCIERLQNDCNPLFNAITCHANASLRELPLGIRLSQAFPRDNRILLHLIGRRLIGAQVHLILQQAKSCGIKSLFALRGDAEIEASEFPFTSDLIKFIRDNYGDYFTICVAGYPEQHPQSRSQTEDIHYLKEKVLAGADFIITQIIFEATTFIKFVKKCRQAGIDAPIIPGVLAVQSYSSLMNMARICKFEVPDPMLRDLDKIKQNEMAVTHYSIFKTVEMVKSLLTQNVISGVHFFTLNREFVTREICRQLGFCLPVPGQMDIFWSTKDSEGNYQMIQFDK